MSGEGSFIDRRGALRCAALVSCASAASPLLSAEPAQAEPVADPFDRLRHRWVSMLTGNHVVDINRSPYAEIAAGVARNAHHWLGSITPPDGDPNALWDDPLSGEHEYNSRITADRLRVLALAWATPGTDLSGSPQLESLLLAALDWFERHRYSILIERWGNWWEWEMGIPIALADLILLLHDPLKQRAPALYDRLAAAINRFTPAPFVGTAANRVWRSHVVMLHAIITRDAKMLVAARDAIPTTFVDVVEGDGFHRDGSFIQHDDLAYNGGYGRELLIRSALLFYLLDGSQWAFARADVEKLRDRVMTAFSPLMYRGAIMDMVRGRNISRANLSDIKSGQIIIIAVLYLAAVLDDRELAGIAKGWIAGQRGYYDIFAYDPMLPAYWLTPHMAWLVRRAVADHDTPAKADLVMTKSYAEMARFVHRRPTFTLAVAMNSKQIQNFETANGENLKGWYTGSGMTTLYQPDFANYADDYWPTVDPYRMPGVTLDRRPRQVGAQEARNESEQVGALALDGAGIAAMLNRTDAGGFSAKVAWYVLDDAVVCVGSGVHSDAQEPTETVIANNLLRAGQIGATLLVDGKAVAISVGDRQTLPAAKWAHLEGVGGLVFPKATAINTLRDQRTGAWWDINHQGASPRDPRTRHYMTLWLDHGSKPAGASYAYILLPGATVQAVKSFAAEAPVQIVSNSDRLHHVEMRQRDRAVSGMTFWMAGSSDDGMVTSSAPLLLMMQRRGKQIELGLADPLPAEAGSIRVTVGLPRAQVVSHDPALAVQVSSDGLRFDLARADLRGRTVRVTLQA